MINKKKAVIFASQAVGKKMRRYVEPEAFVAAADAGWKNAKKLGFLIDLSVGDFDSSAPPQKAKEVLRLPKEKDDTDTHFAAKELLLRGFRSFVLLGVFGGRRDHEMANCQTMLFLAKNGAKVFAADNGLEVHCLGPGKHVLPRGKWRWFSVFAAGEKAHGVCLQGAKYPLKDAVLAPDTPIGASNEFAKSAVTITCKKGYLYLVASR